jgi:C1A family cysteine protease
LTQAEFRSQFLTVDTTKINEEISPLPHVVGENVETTATLVDWTGIYTTPIKDQGYCGCCWAFSSAEQVESDSMRILKASWILSPEQFCQCVTACSGCNGGNTNTALNYAKSHSIEQNADYPYTSYAGVTGSCSYNSAKGVVKVSNFYQISGETNLANYVQTTGPVSILVDASAWNSYTGGIMSAATCGTTIDHAVQAVGVYPVAASSGGYWKVRNQWGTSWGESGYIQLAYGTNTCNIAYQPLYTSVSKA